MRRSRSKLNRQKKKKATDRKLKVEKKSNAAKKSNQK
jgi:hypothetical protein